MPPSPLKPPPVQKTERKRLLKLLSREHLARTQGFNNIAGVDEAGRGPLAGPVVAAACIIKEGTLFDGINDSKMLTPNKRASLYQRLTSHEAVTFGVGVVEPAIIDQINILQATILAMRQAVSNLKTPPDYLLIDGLSISFEGIPTEKIIDGDALVYCICSASIIAKETRDKIMQSYHLQYPEYGFESHKGYGTPQHLAALSKYGPCPIHRFSFSPVKESVSIPVVG